MGCGQGSRRRGCDAAHGRQEMPNLDRSFAENLCRPQQHSSRVVYVTEELDSGRTAGSGRCVPSARVEWRPRGGCSMNCPAVTSCVRPSATAHTASNPRGCHHNTHHHLSPRSCASQSHRAPLSNGSSAAIARGAFVDYRGSARASTWTTAPCGVSPNPSDQPETGERLMELRTAGGESHLGARRTAVLCRFGRHICEVRALTEHVPCRPTPPPQKPDCRRGGGGRLLQVLVLASVMARWGE